MAIQQGNLAVLKHGVSSTYTAIAQVVSIDGPDIKVGSCDNTVLGATVKVSRGTIPDNGTVSMTIFFDPQNTLHKSIYGFAATPSTEQWEIAFGDTGTTTCAFTGYISGFKVNGMEVESNLGADIEITVASALTWAP